MTAFKLQLGTMTATILVLTVAGCAGTSSSPAHARSTPARPEVGQCAPELLAFEFYVPARGSDRTPQSTVYLQSGTVLRFSKPHDVRQSRLDDADLAQLRSRLALAELAKLPEVYRVPPDAPHVLIGIWHKNRVRRYAWTERPFGPGASADEERFARAWSAARSTLDEFAPSSWATLPDSERMFEAVLDALWGH